jgi:histone H3/H4
MQPTLFDSPKQNTETEQILLYALGEFQARGKVLANRELPFDRLHGAFRRAAEKFQIEELADEIIVNALEKMGAKIVRKQSFVAKHPFRVTIESGLAERAKNLYEQILEND